jgi:hypothetical protein
MPFLMPPPHLPPVLGLVRAMTLRVRDAISDAVDILGPEMAKQLVLDELEHCRPRPRPKGEGKRPDRDVIEDLVREYRICREQGMGHTAAIDSVDKTMASATERPGTVKQRLWRHFRREKKAAAKAAKRAEDARRIWEEYSRKRLSTAFTDED